MNCSECRELLVGYIEGLLDADQNQAVESHLNSCAECRKELEHVTSLQNRLVANGTSSIKDDLENAVMDRIVREQALQLRKANQDKQHVNIWRIIMRNRIVQLAMAAVVVGAVIVGIHYFVGSGTSPCLAWDCVINKIMDANAAEYDVIIGEDGNTPVIHDMVWKSRIHRTIEGIPSIIIIDLSTGKILSLLPEEKKAVYIDMKDLPQVPSYIEQLRGVIKTLQDSPHFVVEELGEKVLDNKTASGFRAKNPTIDLTIWADKSTGLPTRIEQQMGQLKITCRNMRFDMPIDESLFSMDAPQGYKVEQQQLRLGATEKDFIEGLRMQAEALYNGQFPDDVSLEYYLKQTNTIKEKFDKMDLPDANKTELGIKLHQGILFTQYFKGEGKWYYAGKGVKLGDANTAIFWYRPKDSRTYRVIYGDLTVKDTAAENLPQPLEKETKELIGYQQWDNDTFVGTEWDQWHIAADGNIVAHSWITVTKGPASVNVMPITLPYGDGELNSVSLGDTSVQFTQTGPGRYELKLPVDKMQAGQTKFECIWRLPLNALERTGDSYRTALKSLIPVGYYKLVIVLEDGCGFVNTDDASAKQFTPFYMSSDKANSNFGSCGIQIKPADK